MKYIKIQYKKILLPVFAVAFLLMIGCASHPYRFRDSEPITEYNDRRPVPVPKPNEYKAYSYKYDVLVLRPAVKNFDVSKVNPARDVNSMDEVPASSWFTPRLGYKNISPGELLNGPRKAGPPQLPIRVVKAKSGGGNPGFIIADSRDKLYLVKFDPPEFPAIETTTDLIVNRLFWGFGYNVPEDYLFHFKKEDLKIDPQGELSKEEIEKVLSKVALPINGVFRSTVSLFLSGVVLGPVPDKGRRKDDPNDKFPHEDLRVLRALRVFAAFVNHSDLRPDNTLDVYVGEKGQGYVKHYLLDFGEAFGGHGAEHHNPADGYTHIFSFKDVFVNMATLGLTVKDWEKQEYTPWQSVGHFDSEHFKPQNWKETYPYEPIRRSQPADNYWGAKILAGLTREHLDALIKAAQYPEKEAQEYLVKILWERRNRAVEYYLSQVSPIEWAGFSNGQLTFKDMGIILLEHPGNNPTYQANFFNGNGSKIGDAEVISGGNGQISIPVHETIIKKSGGYLRVDIEVIRNGHRAPSPAQFHLKLINNKSLKLIGVVH